MKRILSAFLVLIMTLSVMCAAQPITAAGNNTARIAGDINKDGAVDNKDVVELFRIVSGNYSAIYDAAASDFNGDSATDNKDVVALFRAVSTQNNEPEEVISPYGIFTIAKNPVKADVSSPYAILIDAKTKEILYINCSPDKKIYPASTTKVLTAIVALKHCAPDVVFRPGDELSLVASDASTAYTRSQHKLTLEMLIEAMMLPSGCDAAYVIAAGVGRIIAKDDTLSGVEASAVFVEEMNRYSTEVLGLKGSHFACPDGYHKDGTYTTIIDIMTIAYAALSEPVIMKYAGLYHDNVVYASGHINNWNNGNKLINPNSSYYYKYATGIKTGFTEEAGYCLLSSAAYGKKQVIAGVFGATSNSGRFTDSKNLLVAGIGR